MPRKRDIIDMVPMTTETRERRFVAGLIETGSIDEAGKHAGVSHATAYRMAKRPSVIKKWNRALDAAGISDATIAQTYKNALSAEKREQMPDGKGGVKVETYPDHRTRLMAADAVMNWSIKLQEAERDDDDRKQEDADVAGMETTEVLKLIVKKMRQR